MNEQPTARDMIELPNFFLFKIIVKDLELTGDRLMEMVRETLNRSLDSATFQTSPSRKGNYQSHSLKIHIQVYEEIEALYSMYGSLNGVVMTL